jgi:sialic acid synthase SpsE
MSEFYNKIKSNSKPYIVAEIGSNHNGDMDLAKKLILSAKHCGADAAKFQSWTPASLIAKEEYDKNQSYDDGDGGKKHFGSLKEMVEKYYLREEQHHELKEYCDAIGIDFCSTPFSNEEADFLYKLDVPFFKIASMDINNHELLRHVSQYGKPTILSTGMATLGEISEAVDTIERQGNRDIVILHCVSVYPPKLNDINLKNILMLQKAFNYPIGFSDHTIGVSVPLASVALGSCLIEKHFTLDKKMDGWDHEISADPTEMEQLVMGCQNIQSALGRYNRIVSEEEEAKKAKFRRSIVTNKALAKGHVLDIDDITYKRPGNGIQPNEVKYVIGRTVVRDINEDELLTWEHLS